MNFKDMATGEDKFNLYPNDKEREEIQQHVDEFLANGGKITQCDSGVTSYDPDGSFSLPCNASADK